MSQPGRNCLHILLLLFLVVPASGTAQSSPILSRMGQPIPIGSYVDALECRLHGDITDDLLAFRIAEIITSGSNAPIHRYGKRDDFDKLINSGNHQVTLDSAAQTLDPWDANFVTHLDTMVACKAFHQAKKGVVHARDAESLASQIQAPGMQQPATTDASAANASAVQSPVIRSGNFRLAQQGNKWRTIYSLNGTYTLRINEIAISIQSGSARRSDAPRPDPILHSLRLGVCHQTSAKGHWEVLPQQGPESVVSLHDVILKGGDIYHFSPVTAAIPLPNPPPELSWICSFLSEPDGGNYHAHDIDHLPGQQNIFTGYDALDDAIRRKAGSEAVDCGNVAHRKDRSVTDACTVQAYQAGKSFFARYDLMGIDSKVSQGIVGTLQHAVYLYHYDSDPMGGLHVGARVTERLCATPDVVEVNGKQRIGCEVRSGRAMPAEAQDSCKALLTAAKTSAFSDELKNADQI